MLQPTTLSLSSLLSPARGAGAPMATTSDFAMALADLATQPSTEAIADAAGVTGGTVPGVGPIATPIRQTLAASGNIVPIALVPPVLSKILGQPVTVPVDIDTPSPAVACAVEPERPALPDGLLTIAAPIATPLYRVADPTDQPSVLPFARPAETPPVAPEVSVRAAPPSDIAVPAATVAKNSTDVIFSAEPRPGPLATPRPTLVLPRPIADTADRTAPPPVTTVPTDDAVEAPATDDDTAAQDSPLPGEQASAPIVVLPNSPTPSPALASVAVTPLSPLTLRQTASNTVATAARSPSLVTTPAPAETVVSSAPYPRVASAVPVSPILRSTPAESVVVPQAATPSPPLAASRPLAAYQLRAAPAVDDTGEAATSVIATPSRTTLTAPTIAPARPSVLPSAVTPLVQPASDAIRATPTKTAADPASQDIECLQAPDPVPLPGETVVALPVAAVALDAGPPPIPATLQAALASPTPVVPGLAAAPAPVAAPTTVIQSQPVSMPSAAPTPDRPIAAPTPRLSDPVPATVAEHPAAVADTPRPVARPDMRVVMLPPAPPPTPEVLPAAQMFAQAMFASPRATGDRDDAQGDALPISLLTLGSHPAGAGVTPFAVQATSAATNQPALDLSRGEWMTTMIDRIETLRDETGAIGETRLKLAPDALGNVDVSVRRDDAGQYQVRITADTAPARVILADAAPRLADMAEARGLKLSHAGVDGGTGGNTGFTDSNRRDAPPAAVPPRRPGRAANDGDAATDPTIHTTRIA